MTKGKKALLKHFSKLFHRSFDVDQFIDEKNRAMLFFLSDEQGRIVTVREYGVFIPEMLELAYRFPEKLVTEQQIPFEEKNYKLEAIPITLQHSGEVSKGYLGVISNGKEEDEAILHSVLLTFKHLLNHSFNDASVLMEGQNSQKMIAELLVKTNYSDDFQTFAQTFVNYLNDTLVNNGEFTLYLLNPNEDNFIPSCSTNLALSNNSEVDMLFYEAIRKELPKLTEGQVQVLSKSQLSDNLITKGDVMKGFDDFIIIPLEEKEKLFAVLFCAVQSGKIASYSKKMLIRLTQEATKLFYKLLINEKRIKEQQRKDLLLQVTKKFHSSMDVSEILAEIIHAITQVFPSFHTNILLSHEWDVSKDLPVKQLTYGKDKTNEVATNAYLTGKIQIEDIIKDRKSIVYAPLRGKQGVYGVLKICASNSFIFPEHEIDFIEVLADTGGNAIENAELYQQSRQLVEDLQLINKTSHQLNLNLRLSETINYMIRQIKSSFKAQEIGFFMFRSNGGMEVIEGSTSYFLRESSLKDVKSFCCERIKKDKDAVFIGDLAAIEPHLLKPYRSFIAVPMIQSGELKGAVIIVHEHAYFFSFNNFKLLQSLVHHSTLAFTNSMLHEELEKLVITDHLTRLYARSYLDEKVEKSMQKDAFGCFILIDIDNFKQINDIYGHQVGDDIIIQVANVLKKNIKNGDIAARWGGEELAVYLSKVDQSIGVTIAERICKKVAQETSPHVTISCGVSEWKQIDKEKSLKKLFNQADQALYTAKRNGKNIVVVFDENTCYM